MFLRKLLPLALAAALVLFAGCNEEPTSTELYQPPQESMASADPSPTTRRVELSVPTGHALPLEEGERGCQTYAFSHGKLLYSIDYTDPSIDQPSPEEMDVRYYIYDTTTRETTELGQILWRFAANENMVCFPSGKVYLAYDDCGHSAGNKIVEVDLLQSTVTNRVIMDSVNLCSLVKISDTELIYDVEQGTDTRTYSYFIYNSETHTSRLLLTTQYHVETESGKILQRARRVGDEIYVLVQTVDGTTRSNVLERYSMDGEPMGTIPVPEAMNPYVNSGGEAYYISDFDVRGDLYSFNAAGDVFFTRMDGVYEKQTLERGWGTLYPESDPRYLIETDLYENSRMFVTDLETEKTTECHFNIDSEYNSIYRLQMDHSGQTDQIALICATTNPDPQKAFTPQYQAYFMNFSDILSAMQQAES